MSTAHVQKVHLFLSTWIYGSYTPKSFDPRKDRSVLKYFCLASSHFPSILSSCKRLKNRPDCYVLVKRQKVFATNSNCPDNLRNLACFEEVGGSLWIIKSFYRNSETVGQQCHGFMPVPTVTETFQKEQLVFEDLRFKPDVKSTFSLLYPFSWKKSHGHL